MIRILPAALAAMLLAALPAQARDTAALDCIATELAPGARASLEADVTKNLTIYGEPHEYSAATRSGIVAASDACKARLGWSDEATKAARIYAVSSIGLPVARNAAAAKGLNVAALEAIWNAVPAAERAYQFETAGFEALAMKAIGQKLLKDGEEGEVAGELFGFLNMVEVGRRQFTEAP